MTISRLLVHLSLARAIIFVGFLLFSLPSFHGAAAVRNWEFFMI